MAFTRRVLAFYAAIVLAIAGCIGSAIHWLDETSRVGTDAESGSQSSKAARDFLSEFHLQSIVLRTDVKVDPGRIASIVDRTAKEVSRITGLPIPERKLPVYLCTNMRQVREVGNRYGFRPLDSHGVFYRRFPLVIVQDCPIRDTTISHEMVHWVIAHSISDCPSLVNEGVAVLVSERAVVLAHAEEYGKKPSTLRLQRRRARRLRGFLERSEPYRLVKLLRLSYEEFRELGEDDQLFYDLGMCLARTLEESGVELGASMETMFRKLRSNRDPLGVIKSLYSIGDLEFAWHDTIEFVAGGGSAEDAVRLPKLRRSRSR